jgi:alpha-galactosidase/6-phospho-beta-glucosidase family protein
MNKITQFFKKKTNESFGYELLDEDIKSDVTIMDLNEMKKNYSEIFEIARKICEEEDIEINICFSTTKKNTFKKTCP